MAALTARFTLALCILAVLVLFLWVLIVPQGQLGLHPYYSHPGEIDRVRSAFQDPRCKPGQPDYQEYWSESLQQWMFVCRDFTSGKTVVWFWYRSGGAGEAREITGFFSKVVYLSRVVIRDGYTKVPLP